MKLFQVDSFSNEPFKGNPAGVCIMEKLLDAYIMQKIATEMNISETAFIYADGNSYTIRYFTPTREVPMCGHATLATAHVLFELGMVDKKSELIFKAQETDLKIEFVDSWIRMHFPLYKIKKVSNHQIINNIFNIDILEVYKSNNNWYVILLETQDDVINLNPNFTLMLSEDFGDLFAVTSRSNLPEYDFFVRVFCNPKYGITEDPVTGSANCILAPFWKQKLNKTTFISKQLSKRSGIIKSKIENDHIIIMGQAITIFKIELHPLIISEFNTLNLESN